MRRNGVILPAAFVAVIAVGGVSTAAWLMGPSASGASGAAAGLESITNTKAVALLQQEHQQAIVMSNASRTLTVVAKAKVATPSSAVASANQSSSSSSTGTAAEPTAAAPNPGTAQSIAYNMLASFGFSTSQFGCLQDIWQRESGWSYDAENPSGAYGIPQSLPASKMASAGSDYLTNPATQIKWGLGYIKDVYGSPCAAWNFELANNYY
ncbi:MAG TPA: transglycosylase SLT domain-containing protein [Streptosporangiaceae bacterium]|jgi:hypothetical protein